MTQAEKTRALIFILLTISINMIGVGLAWPVLPKLVQEMGGGDISNAAYIYAIIGILFAISQFLFSPLLGNLSDRFGRKPILVISLLGLSFDYILTALVPSYFWLGVVRFIGGIFAATITTANAYAADISTPENRAKNFGYIGAAFGLGFILGPVIGGWLGAIDIRYPFYAAGILAFANALFGWIALPESLSFEKRRQFDLSESNPIRALKRVTRFPALSALLISLFITATAQRGLEAIWVLYLDFRYGWDIRAAAWSLAFVGVMYFLIQGFAVGPVVKRFGEWRTLIFGFALAGVCFVLYAAANQGWMIYPLIAIYAVGNGVAGPALNAICSKTVSEDRQGQLQGALQSINSLAVIVGPFFASVILGHVSSENPIIDMPGAWFALCALAFVFALMLTIRGFKDVGR